MEEETASEQVSTTGRDLEAFLPEAEVAGADELTDADPEQAAGGAVQKVREAG